MEELRLGQVAPMYQYLVDFGKVIRTTQISSSRQLIEQRLRLLQVGGVEAFGKPARPG
jgi:hypothetical protein